MKKPVISFSAVLIMMLSISLFASAEEYCSLGSYTTGRETNCFIAFLSEDADVSSDELPAGCELSLEGGSLSLTGTPQTAGEYTFTVNVSGDNGENVIVCSLDINTGAPTVSITRDIRCCIDTPITVKVEATTGDSGTLSYQWYAGVGSMAVPISGANSETYEPGTFKEGLFGYYCSVTNTNNGESAYTDSEPVYITVTSPVITSVAIDTPPRKNEYRLGDRPSASGMSLTISYDDGSTETVTSGFTFSPEKFSEAGRQTVTVSYAGKSCTFAVKVLDSDESSASSMTSASKPVTLVTPALSPAPASGGTLQSEDSAAGSSETDTAPSPAVTAPPHEKSVSAGERQSSAPVVIIFIVSLTALAALGAYLIYTRKKEK